MKNSLVLIHRMSDDAQQSRPRFEVLLNPLFDRLWSFVSKLEWQRYDAEDLLHDAILRAYTAYEQLRDLEKFKSWIFQIVYRESVTRQRRKRVTPFLDIPLDENMVADSSSWEACSWESSLVHFGEEVQRAVDDLVMPHREVIWLRYVEGFEHIEMARILSITEGTVASRLSRARALLKERLWEYVKEIGFGRDTNEM